MFNNLHRFHNQTEKKKKKKKKKKSKMVYQIISKESCHLIGSTVSVVLLTMPGKIP